MKEGPKEQILRELRRETLAPKPAKSGRRKVVKKILTVVVEAGSQATVEAMIEALARSACDVANSTEDDNAHIAVRENNPSAAREKKR